MPRCCGSTQDPAARRKRPPCHTLLPVQIAQTESIMPLHQIPAGVIHPFAPPRTSTNRRTARDCRPSHRRSRPMQNPLILPFRTNSGLPEVSSRMCRQPRPLAESTLAKPMPRPKHQATILQTRRYVSRHGVHHPHPPCAHWHPTDQQRASSLHTRPRDLHHYSRPPRPPSRHPSQHPHRHPPKLRAKMPRSPPHAELVCHQIS